MNISMNVTQIFRSNRPIPKQLCSSLPECFCSVVSEVSVYIPRSWNRTFNHRGQKASECDGVRRAPSAVMSQRTSEPHERRTKGDYALTDTCLINTGSFILLLPFTSDLTLSVRTASALTEQGEGAVSGRRACPRAVSVASRTYEQNRRDRRGEGLVVASQGRGLWGVDQSSPGTITDWLDFN